MPPRYSTWSWRAAKESVAALARLGPRVLACGHEPSMSGCETAPRYIRLAIISDSIPTSGTDPGRKCTGAPLNACRGGGAQRATTRGANKYSAGVVGTHQLALHTVLRGGSLPRRRSVRAGVCRLARDQVLGRARWAAPILGEERGRFTTGKRVRCSRTAAGPGRAVVLVNVQFGLSSLWGGPGLRMARGRVRHAPRLPLVDRTQHHQPIPRGQRPPTSPACCQPGALAR